MELDSDTDYDGKPPELNREAFVRDYGPVLGHDQAKRLWDQIGEAMKDAGMAYLARTVRQWEKSGDYPLQVEEAHAVRAIAGAAIRLAVEASRNTEHTIGETRSSKAHSELTTAVHRANEIAVKPAEQIIKELVHELRELGDKYDAAKAKIKKLTKAKST